MGIRIRKFGEFLHVESGIWENLTCGIRNPGLWNLKESRTDPTNDWNPKSMFH